MTRDGLALLLVLGPLAAVSLVPVDPIQAGSALSVGDLQFFRRCIDSAENATLRAFDDKRVELNAQTGATDEVRVEIADPGGERFGALAVVSDPLFGDHLARKVSRRGRSAVGALAGNPARFHFLPRNLKLHAFVFRS